MKKSSKSSKHLSVPDADTLPKFLTNARTSWRAHHGVKPTRRGPKSLVSLVMEEFANAHRELVKEIKNEHDKLHLTHASAPVPEDSIFDCLNCIQILGYKKSRYALAKKILKKLQRKFGWDDETKKQKQRTIERHVNSLLYLINKLKDGETEFPEHMKSHFPLDMPEAFAENKDRIFRELSSGIGSGFSVYELEKFYGHVDLPPALRPPKSSK